MPRRGDRLRGRPAGPRRPLLRRPGGGAARRDEPRAGARDRPDRRTPASAARPPRAKPAFGFRALRFLNKWHFISNDLMEQERRKRGSADYLAAEGVMREVLVKAVNEDYGDALDALASNRAAGGDGLGRARHRGDRWPWPSRPGPGSVRTPTWSSCPARRTCSTTGWSRRSRDGAIDQTPGGRECALSREPRNVLVGLAISLLALASYLRWWRVAQREHYEPGRLVVMAAIWCRAQPANVLALAAVVALCLVGLKLPLVGLVGAVVWLLWPPGLALLRPSQEAGVDPARASARGDHRRAARRGHRLLPGLRRGGRAGAAAGAADRRGRAAGRAPARGPPQPHATRSRPPQGSSRSRRGWWRSPGPTARPRPRTTPRT